MKRVLAAATISVFSITSHASNCGAVEVVKRLDEEIKYEAMFPIAINELMNAGHYPNRYDEMDKDISMEMLYQAYVRSYRGTESEDLPRMVLDAVAVALDRTISTYNHQSVNSIEHGEVCKATVSSNNEHWDVYYDYSVSNGTVYIDPIGDLI